MRQINVIKRLPGKTKYTVINQHVFAAKLNLDTLGLIVFILSQDANWQMTTEELLTLLNTGKTRLYRMIKELREAGFIRKIQFKNDRGEWRPVEYHVSEEPEFKKFY